MTISEDAEWDTGTYILMNEAVSVIDAYLSYVHPDNWLEGQKNVFLIRGSGELCHWG